MFLEIFAPGFRDLRVRMPACKQPERPQICIGDQVSRRPWFTAQTMELSQCININVFKILWVQWHMKSFLPGLSVSEFGLT